jgi:hypothetical protein
MPFGDKGANIWNLWWVYYALFERGISPLRCDLIFIPWGCDLRFHTLSITNGIIASPITATLGPVVAYNALFVMYTALTGCFASMWAMRFGARRPVALLIGLIMAFGPYRWAHQIHLNLFSTAWLFLSFYYCERSIASRKGSDAVGVSLAWLLAFFSDWYYGLFVGFYLSVRACLLLIQKRDISNMFWVLRSVVAPGALVGMAVYAYLHLGSEPNGYVDPVAMKFSAFWSVDLMHLAAPLWLLDDLSHLQQSEEFRLNPGLLMMLLPLVFGWFKGNTEKDRWNRRILLILSAVFMVLSLGPVLMFNAHPVTIMGCPIFLPAGIFELIPALTVIRVYARFAYIGLAVYLLFGLLGLQNLVDKHGISRVMIFISLVLGTIFLIETGWRLPRMIDYQAPAGHYQPSSKPVLEIPFTPSKLSGIHLYHQTIHQQPIFIAEFSRLGSYRNAYLQAYPALGMLNRIVSGKEMKNFKPPDMDKFCQELKQLGPVNIILSSIQQEGVSAEEARKSIQTILDSCHDKVD